MKKPLVSVIIPVYNGAKTVGRAFESVINQTMGDFEIVFVNDGSTDASHDIMQRLCALDSRARLIDRPNGGVSAARNTGLAYAEGEYIAFLDDDDEYNPRYLEIMCSYAREDTVCINVYDEKMLPVPENIPVKISSRLNILRDFLYGRVHTGVCTAVFPKKVFDANGLRFLEGCRYSEDLHMMWRVFCCIERVAQVSCPLYVYTVREGSATTKLGAERFDSLRAIGSLEDFVLVRRPEFYREFKQYAVARMAWSLLWQEAHYLPRKGFLLFADEYDFKGQLRKLYDYPSLKVRLSSRVFNFSPTLYHAAVKIITFRFRRSV